MKKDPPTDPRPVTAPPAEPHLAPVGPAGLPLRPRPSKCIPCTCPVPEPEPCPVSFAPCPPTDRPDPPFSTFTAPSLTIPSSLIPTSGTSTTPHTTQIPSTLESAKFVGVTEIPEDEDANGGFMDEG
jgi:hypothetical protein